MASELPLHGLITHDPVSGEELIVTRLECPPSGILIEGAFSLGWIAKLTPEQLDFVGGFLRQRGNLQKLAPELGVSYNTARNRLDEITTALGGRPEERAGRSRIELLEALRQGEIDVEEALADLKRS